MLIEARSTKRISERNCRNETRNQFDEGEDMKWLILLLPIGVTCVSFSMFALAAVEEERTKRNLSARKTKTNVNKRKQ